MSNSSLTVLDWLTFFGHFALLSLLSVGGAVTVASDLHRRLVDGHHWLTDSQFAASIALAQAAPGPNVLFVGLVGWHVGLNAGPATGSYGLALFAMGLALLGALLPSSVLTLVATRWARRHHQDRSVRAFKQGMAPVVIGMMLATAAVLLRAYGPLTQHASLWLLAGVAAVLAWRTRLHLLWMLGAGAILGALGRV